MPAIQPARLKIEITKIIAHFSDPVEFVRSLHDLFDFYADRTRHPGRGGKPFSLVRAYNVHRQVLQQIEGDLAPKAAADPERALALADALWQENWLECRLLAIAILGEIPPDPPERVVERIQAWGRECGQDRQLDASLMVGLVQLRKETPELFLRILETWITSPDLASQKVGLRVLPPLVEDASFENLPAVFHLIAPLVRNVDTVLEVDLLGVLHALAQRSPRETAYFLRQSLIMSNRPGVTSLVWQSLRAFPPEVEASLRELLRRC
ncbi:MAG: DNA alkylation repair protein [Chloroflexi bacterium]|nr:DNA alkylation repair protein [Chloroflexota bacterium]MBU1660253.1 DNA alkylation repair protein [Chloroflexota bacterium]